MPTKEMNDQREDKKDGRVKGEAISREHVVVCKGRGQ
jgi:hypothetical protein